MDFVRLRAIVQLNYSSFIALGACGNVVLERKPRELRLSTGNAAVLREDTYDGGFFFLKSRERLFIYDNFQ
jgi:hypothetical protein